MSVTTTSSRTRRAAGRIRPSGGRSRRARRAAGGKSTGGNSHLPPHALLGGQTGACCHGRCLLGCWWTRSGLQGSGGHRFSGQGAKAAALAAAAAGALLQGVGGTTRPPASAVPIIASSSRTLIVTNCAGWFAPSNLPPRCSRLLWVGCALHDRSALQADQDIWQCVQQQRAAPGWPGGRGTLSPGSLGRCACSTGGWFSGGRRGMIELGSRQQNARPGAIVLAVPAGRASAKPPIPREGSCRSTRVAMQLH